MFANASVVLGVVEMFTLAVAGGGEARLQEPCGGQVDWEGTSSAVESSGGPACRSLLSAARLRQAGAAGRSTSRSSSSSGCRASSGSRPNAAAISESVSLENPGRFFLTSGWFGGIVVSALSLARRFQRYGLPGFFCTLLDVEGQRHKVRLADAAGKGPPVGLGGVIRDFAILVSVLEQTVPSAAIEVELETDFPGDAVVARAG